VSFPQLAAKIIPIDKHSATTAQKILISPSFGFNLLYDSTSEKQQPKNIYYLFPPQLDPCSNDNSMNPSLFILRTFLKNGEMTHLVVFQKDMVFQTDFLRARIICAEKKDRIVTSEHVN